MRFAVWTACAVMLLTGIAAAQPVLSQGGVLNSASYGLDGMPNEGVAQGSMFLIYGNKMGPANLVIGTVPLQTTLSGTSAKVTSGGTTVDVYIYYTSSGLVAAVLPSTTPVGNATLTLTYNGQTSTAVTFKVVQSNPGTYTQNSAGSGPAIFQNYVSATSTPLNTVMAPAKPNQVGILWGSGMWPADFSDANYPVVKNLPANLEVWVGNKKATILYKGRSPQFPGVDQINLQLAPDTPLGCYVPLVEKVDNAIGNYTTIAVSADGGPCSDPTGFSSADLAVAQANGKFRMGNISLSRSLTKLNYQGLTGQIKVDAGSGAFESFLLGQLTASQGVSQYTTFGTCIVAAFKTTQTGATDPIVPAGLDAGTAINVSGPQGAKQMTAVQQTTGMYSAQFANATVIPNLPVPIPGQGTPYLEKGVYTIDNGNGGKDVGPFHFTMNLPDPLVWSNEDSINAVTRSQGVQVTWTGGDPASFVFITGISMGAQVAGMFICTAPVSAGSFAVPSIVTLALPVSATSSGSPTGTLAVGSSGTPVRFTATGLDAGYGQYSYSNMKTLGYN